MNTGQILEAVHSNVCLFYIDVKNIHYYVQPPPFPIASHRFLWRLAGLVLATQRAHGVRRKVFRRALEILKPFST